MFQTRASTHTTRFRSDRNQFLSLSLSLLRGAASRGGASFHLRYADVIDLFATARRGDRESDAMYP